MLVAALVMQGGPRDLGPVSLAAVVDITDLPGTVSDQYGTTGVEGVDKVIDNTPYMKYFTSGSTPWVQFVADNAAVVTGYSVTVANDWPDRDPKDWVFEASTTGTTWTTLNTQTNQTFVSRFVKKTYSFSNTASYRYYRLRITASNGSPNFQMSELQIFGTTTGTAPAPAAPSGISANAVSDEQVQITWNDNTRYETGYGLERRVGAGAWTLVKNLPIGTTRYYDIGRSGSTTYTYRVRALGTPDSAYATSSAVTTMSTTPPATYMETFHVPGGHPNELLTLVSATSDVVIYRDPNVSTANLGWAVTYIQQIYGHVRASYPAMQGQRLWVTLHHDFGPGGTAGFYGNPATKFHNMAEVADLDWTTPTGLKLDTIAHEIAHTIEFAGYGVLDSPAFALWGDGKWAEIFNYWAYRGAGLNADANRWFIEKTTDAVDGFPAATTDWFTQWFYPITNNYNGATTLNNYFLLLSQHYHKFNGHYPDLYPNGINMGEFVHFWSGATGANQQPRAQTAFGWNATWQAELTQAKADFPGVTYTP
jgi:hypothetical protein